jgi:dTDP-4-amino-4,6-dideoxygalactose transaminase
VPDGSRCTYNYFAILIDPAAFGATNREVYDHLAANGVESKIYFHPPIHEQVLYRHLGTGAFPNTTWVCERILCLPITGHLDERSVETIVGFIREAPARARVKADARS